jgi:hypothetical protein
MTQLLLASFVMFTVSPGVEGSCSHGAQDTAMGCCGLEQISVELELSYGTSCGCSISRQDENTVLPITVQSNSQDKREANDLLAKNIHEEESSFSEFRIDIDIKLWSLKFPCSSRLYSLHSSFLI